MFCVGSLTVVRRKYFSSPTIELLFVTSQTPHFDLSPSITTERKKNLFSIKAELIHSRSRWLPMATMNFCFGSIYTPFTQMIHYDFYVKSRLDDGGSRKVLQFALFLSKSGASLGWGDDLHNKQPRCTVLITIAPISRKIFNFFITDVHFIPYKDIFSLHPTFSARSATHNFTSARMFSFVNDYMQRKRDDRG